MVRKMAESVSLIPYFGEFAVRLEPETGTDKTISKRSK